MPLTDQAFAYAIAREAHIDGRGSEEDPADWLTEVQIPLAPAEAAPKSEAGRDA